jgi:arylsulfatase A-like enzyme
VIGTHDMVATALDFAGVDVPKGQALDSVSLVPVLTGKRGDDRPVRDSLLVQSSPGRGPFVDKGFRTRQPASREMAKKKPEKKGRALAFALYQGDWKLVLHGSGEPAALYNLSDDLAEETNILDKHPERVTSMTENTGKFDGRVKHITQNWSVSALTRRTLSSIVRSDSP